MSFKTVLKAAFPFIATAAEMGGPIGMMAATAVGNALGIPKVEPTERGINDAVTAAQAKDPEALLKLQKAEEDFQVQMTALGFDNIQKLEQIAAEDRANARAREIAVKDVTPKVLAYGTTAGFFILLAGLVFRAIPPESREVLSAMTGVLGTMTVGINTYYFGSSSGSAAKTRIMAAERKS